MGEKLKKEHKTSNYWDHSKILNIPCMKPNPFAKVDETYPPHFEKPSEHRLNKTNLISELSALHL